MCLNLRNDTYMDLTTEHLYITANELDAGLLASSARTWNAACTITSFVFHNGEWQFRLPISHLDEFRASLEATAALPSRESTESFTDKFRFERGQKIAGQLLQQLGANL